MKYNLTALIKYLKDEFGGIHERLDGIQNSFSNLQSSVDSLAKNADENRKELKIIRYTVVKIENWIIKAADKIKIPYDH